MYPTSPKYSRDHSRDMQVLRSIDAKTEVSQARQQQELMKKLLMLSIEIDRKDSIIKQLLSATNNNRYEIEMEELMIRCQHYEMEIKTLRQTVQMLKDNISVIESTKNKEVFNSVNHQFNQQLEDKVHTLEGRLRTAEDDKVMLNEQIKQLKLNQSMMQYKLLRDGQNQKGRVRELEGLLLTERTRVQTERKASGQKGLVIEELKNRLMQCESNQRLIIQQYQQKLRMLESSLIYHQNLKKSQIVTTEEKANASAQEVYRLNEEVKYLKQSLEAERQSSRSKEKEYGKLMNENKSIENRSIRLEGELKEINVRLQSKQQELKLREREIGEKEGLIKKLYGETEEIKFYFTNKNEEIQIYTTEIARLKEEVTSLYHQNDQQKNQLRKLKRKPISSTIQCESCKAREAGSSTLIASQKSIKALNIEQIIQQTEQLFRSNRRIENLITKHESGGQSSIQVYNDHGFEN